MSNAVAQIAEIVPSDSNNLIISSTVNNNNNNNNTVNSNLITLGNNNNNNSNKQTETDNSAFGSTSTSSSSSNLTSSSPVNSSTNSETSSGFSSGGDMNSSNNTNTTNTLNTINTSLNGATNNLNNINSYYHPNQQQQFHHHPPHLNLNHLHPQQPQMAGIQYIQFSSANSPISNQATTPSINGSPLASLTSSPNNTSFQYHSPQHHPHHHPHHHHQPAHLLNHHAISNNLIQHHPHHHQQQQQFQQLQQFHSFHSNYKDTRWLTLEVCREFQRNKCNRNETECKFAHPPAHVEIINGKVIACYDSLKGKCTRKEPPCKYLHPPQHLKDQLLQNGKNNLVLRQVALAMMHQQQQQQQQQQTNSQPTAALIAAAAAANNSVSQYQFTTSPNGTVQSSSNQQQQQQTNNNSTNNSTPNQSATPTATPTTTTTATTQFIPTSLTTTNGGLTTYSQVQLATNGNGAQAHLLPMLANGFHPHPHHHLQQMQQAIYATAADPTTAALLQVSAVSPGAANPSLLPPQQRTDRLQLCKEFKNGTCNKPASECSFAHPPPQCPIDAENSLVTVCVDFIKGKCARETCKYFHPPEHLVTQLKKQKITNNAAAAAAAAALAATNNLTLLPTLSQTSAGSGGGLHSLYNPTSHLQFNNNQYRLQNYPSNQFSYATTNNHHHHNHHHRQFGNNTDNNINNDISYYSLPIYDYSALATVNFANNKFINASSSNVASNLNLMPDTINALSSSVQFAIQQPLATFSSKESANASNFRTNNNILLRTGNNSFLGNAQLTAALASSTNLASDLNDAACNAGATFTLDNGQTYQIPQFQIYTPIFQRAPNANLNISQNNGSNEELNAANTSATATATTIANMVDVVPSKKRQHDAIEQDFIPMSAANLYQTTALPVKRTALTDSKTGMPMFQPFTQNHSNQATALHHLHQGQAITIAQHPSAGGAISALNYPINFATMQYAPYPTTFSLPYNGHPASLPRL